MRFVGCRREMVIQSLATLRPGVRPVHLGLLARLCLHVQVQGAIC
jgi:hypothetical protein